MGQYSDRLALRVRGKAQATRSARDPNVEHLTAVAIQRDGKWIERGFRSHWELRNALNPERLDNTKTIPGDVDGFVTSKGRFLTRREAADVALASGQLSFACGREMLSSDLDW